MAPVYLFDSGGSKTTLLISNGDEIEEKILPGYNPNRKDLDIKELFKEIEIPISAEVFFYGAGLSDPRNRSLVEDYFNTEHSIKASVESDLLGSARALLGNEPGVFAIVGTGSIAGYYDGKDVVRRSGGWGYLIDDIGGGYELGRSIVSAWLDGILEKKLSDRLEEHFGLSRDQFTGMYYKDPSVSTIAEVPKLIHEYRSQPVLHELVSSHFDRFITRHVVRLCHESNCDCVGFTGGLAFYFRDIIGSVSVNHGLTISNILDKPARALLEFHRK